MLHRVGHLNFKSIAARLGSKYTIPERLRTSDLMTKEHHEFYHVLFILQYIELPISECV